MKTRVSRRSISLVWGLGVMVWPMAVSRAQLTDTTQTPNTANVGIHRSLADQVGAGRGDVMTPDSSLFIIKRDPFRSVRRGRQIFQRKFTVAQGFSPRTGDGVGNIDTDGSLGAGLVDSCAGCHGRPHGGAGFGGNVFTRPDSRDAPHLFGLGIVEMLADEITHDLRAIRQQAIDEAQQENEPETRLLVSKGIHYGYITAMPDGTVNTSNVHGVNADLRVRPFFAQGGTISMREFIVGAFNAEMGLEAPDPDLAAASAGGRVVTPAGMVLDGSLDTIEAPPVSSPFEDGDGVVNEIPTALVDHVEFYLLNYFKPGLYKSTKKTRKGRNKFEAIGCAFCHVPDLLIEHDRRVADVETNYSASEPGFNHLFTVATTLFDVIDDGSGLPPLKRPQGGPFLVRNIYADFRSHDLGPKFNERNFDGTITTRFMTEPLWGVGTTAPYGHDGRSINLTEVILRHGGEAQASRDAFVAMGGAGRSQILAFLNSLILFPPGDTASNLNPGDPSTPGFPQFGHGSIKLGVLFNDPSIGE